MTKKTSFKISSLEERKRRESLDPDLVRADFDQRVQQRTGIDVVLSNRFSREENEKFDQAIVRLVEKYFKDVSFSKVLEVGVGIGRLARLFAPRTHAFVGVDFSSMMLESAYKLLSCFDNIELQLGDVADFNFGENKFDLGIASLVLKHNNDRRAKQIIENLKKCCSSVLLIEHVTGGAEGSSIAIIRDKDWYLNLFAPEMKPVVTRKFNRHNDKILFTILEYTDVVCEMTP